MKININDIRIAPTTDVGGFKLCCFGDLSELLEEWVSAHNFETEESGRFTNIIIPNDTNVDDIFEEDIVYNYVDGFSPNLNKHLHIGHLSNLVLAKTFQKMGIGKKFVALLGDTLTGDVEQIIAHNAFKDLIEKFDYRVDETFFASNMRYDNDEELTDGEGSYEGSKAFDFGDGTKIVGIKSDGSTSYFYQDVALASTLLLSTLYLTGNEQSNHFKYLKKLYPHTNHIPLGLITTDGKKESSRSGEVKFAQDIIDILLEEFPDEKLVYNIIAGQILKSVPKNNIEIKLKQISNPKTSLGLYLSYTLARMKNTGLEYEILDKFNSTRLSFIAKKAKKNLNPSLLFNELDSLCKHINSLYGKYSIKENPDNEKYFTSSVQDLEYGMKLLGLFSVDKV
jgi:arginyl-tRNA synthetase